MATTKKSPASRYRDAARGGRFAGLVAVVTGAAQGIGRAVALKMAAEGAHLALVDRSEIVDEVRDGINSRHSGQAIAIHADVEQYDECARMMKEAFDFQGRIDVLVNNVGGTIWAKPFQHYRPDEIEKEIRRSLYPTLWCCHAVLPFMQQQRRGGIVNVSSVATRGLNRVPYGAAKGGVNAMTACLAWENAEYGIRVNGVAPGGTDVGPRRIPRNPNAPASTAQEQAWYQTVIDQTIDSALLHRYGSPDEQAHAILFLASGESSYITGVTLPVAGGDLG